MSRWVALPALAATAVAAALFVPFLTKEREVVAAIPSPRPVFEVSLVDVPPGEKLCIADVTIPGDARQLRFHVLTRERRGPALDVTLRAHGYDERLTVAGGYPESTLISAPMNPPAAASLGDVCLRQRGSAPIELVGSQEERTKSRPESSVGATVQDADTYLAFYANGRATALDRAGAIVDHMSAFRPAVVGPWLLWPLLVLVVLGVPGGVLWAALRGARA
jgi:hypothetical protein